MCLQINPGHFRSYSSSTQSFVLVGMILDHIEDDSGTYPCEIRMTGGK